MEELNRNSSKKLLHKKEIGVMFGYGRDKTGAYWNPVFCRSSK